MKERTRNKIIATILLFTIIIVRFAFVGNSLAIAITEDSNKEIGKTNNENVKFNVGLKEKEMNTIEKSADTMSEETIYITIEVKNRGLLKDGIINIVNPNFEILQNKVQNNYIKEIENNNIHLNTITYGNVVELEIPIKFLKKEKFETNYFDKDININFNGKYENENEETVTADKSIKINWTTESDMTFTQNVGRYIDLGENGVILEQIIETNIKNNNLPREQETLTIEVPKLENKTPEFVYVLLNGKKLNQDEVVYTIKDGILNIIPQKDLKELQTWGNENNKYEVIYKYGKEENKENKNINLKTIVNTKLYTKDSIQKNDVQEHVNIVKNGNITELKSEINSTIYKGYLYANVNKDTEIKEINKVKIIENQMLNNLTIITGENRFIDKQGKQFTADKNVFYKTTKILKENMINILGTESEIRIKDFNGNIITTINNETPVNENGEIIITYPENQNKIIIETTKPIQDGELVFENIKTVKNNNIYNSKTIKEFNNLKIENIIKTNINTVKEEKNIELHETKEEARIEINNQHLSTLSKNNREIKIILKTNEPRYNLYKNPLFVIELPEEVENIKVNSINMLYENELKVKNYIVEGRIIKLEIEGEQTEYKNETIEGANIVIDADITLNKKATSRDANIRMAYTNNNIQGKEIYQTNQMVKIDSPNELILLNNISSLGIETLGNNEIETKNIERGAHSKVVEGNIEIINNKQKDITNVKVLGEFPSNNAKNNMGIKIKEGLTLKTTKNVKIYYTDNENANDDITNQENGWNENFSEIKNVKKYLILMDDFKKTESIIATYKMEIPSNLEYNQNATTKYIINYDNNESKIKEEKKSTPILLTTGIGPNLEVKLTATRGGQEITTPVKNREVIKYKIEVSNIGTEEANNVKVSAEVPNGTTMVQPMDQYEYNRGQYYEELTKTKYEEIIQNIKPNETITKEYEVRVNSTTAEGTIFKNVAEVYYGDVNKKSNELTYKSQKGELELIVKRVTDVDNAIYPGAVVRYHIIVNNISDVQQDNIKINIKLPNFVQCNEVQIIKGLNVETEENIVTEDTIYSDEINIGNIRPKETIIIDCALEVKKTKDNLYPMEVYAVGRDSKNKEYISNNYIDKVYFYKLDMKQTSLNENEFLKTGDTIEYKIEVTNIGENKADGITIKDQIPEQLTVKEVTVNNNKVEDTDNYIVKVCNIEPKETIEIKIVTVVNYSMVRDQVELISNYAIAEDLNEEVARTNVINHYIKEETGGDTGGDTGGNTGGDTDNNQNNGNKLISGIAWLDENKNGRKDFDEKAVTGIKAKLLNVENNRFVNDKNGGILEVETNENGVYMLNNIKEGKYIVVFEFDLNKYDITKYKENGISEKENSNAMRNQLNINGKLEDVISTDIIHVKEGDIANINIGLKKLEKFDLKLDKYISRVIIKDAKGTQVKGYTDTKLAKIEIDPKKLKNTEIVIEYTLKISNLGEIPGYARKIVDYFPQDMKFDKESNPGWYIKDNNLYNSTLVDEKINPGEAKEIKLTMSKKMNENNTGTIVNIAEIEEDYNELGIKDNNSKPGNRIETENDLDKATYIVAIKTGANIYLTISMIMIGLIIVYVTLKIKERR